MSKSHPEGNSNITYQSKNILDFFRQFIFQRSCFRCWLAQWGMKQPGTHTPNHWSYQQRWVKPELKESHENMEPAGAGPELQGLQDAQVQGMDDHFSENTVYKPVSSVQSLSRVQLFATPWIAAHQASLSITNSQNLPKLISIKLVMPSHPLLSLSTPAPNPSQHQGLFQWVSSSHGGQSIGVSASTSVLPMNTQISFRMSWLDLLTVQGPLKSLLQHYSSKASILPHSAFFTVQFSHPDMTTGKTIALIRWTSVSKVMSLLFNMLSRLFITFLPRSKCLLISWL